MTKFEIEVLLQMKNMELNQLVNSVHDVATKKTGFLGSSLGLEAQKMNAARIKVLKTEISSLEAMTPTK